MQAKIWANKVDFSLLLNFKNYILIIRNKNILTLLTYGFYIYEEILKIIFINEESKSSHV